MAVDLKDEEAVAQAVRQQIKGMLDKNIASLKQVITPDAKLFHITGDVQSRDEWLKQIRIGRMHYFNNREILFQVKVTNGTAVVISRNELDARIYGFRNIWPLQSRIKLAKIDEHWLITESHASMY
ncbi:nuclear transport factor 2 family protein [Pediococcus pentosaceus]|uniref:nuclear transport factor 2 family protein n=1 Tax=Pediococcus pentosaceus TaxID=1255 RepID=UPI0018E192F7|nr:nuclear transport factor 2 family protein [Pediococcus pentosaceus]MBF7104349.1 nuclear transport factor 2 family protein [Pediococcus pentosaceus]QQC61229.1 nuclear transport factor 2 family protein [Pediococcus pentosaceus]